MASVASLPKLDEVVKRGNELVGNTVKPGDQQWAVDDVVPYSCNIATCITKNLLNSFDGMDENLKVAITTTGKYLSQAIKSSNGVDRIRWEAVISAMKTNPTLEPMDDDSDIVDRSDKIVKKDVDYFKFDGSPDAGIVKEVHSWFKKLISDEEVLNEIQFNNSMAANMVKWIDAIIRNSKANLLKQESYEKKVMELGVIQFPDIKHPYFKVYKIILNVWSQSTSLLGFQHGIVGQFTSLKFKPRINIIQNLPKDVQQKAIGDAKTIICGEVDKDDPQVAIDVVTTLFVAGGH